MIYLDCNATTPVDREVGDAVAVCLRDVFGNPASSHLEGRKARAVVDKAREELAALVDCHPGEIYFTSGGTESNNLAVLGTALRRGRGHVITSRIEHPSITNAMKHLQALGFEVTSLPVDELCRVSARDLEAAIREDTALISIMHSNNETGTLQPVEEMYSVARERGVPLHTDAAQSVGKVAVDARAADMMTIAGHKFYGPKGIGAIYIRRGLEPAPIMYGAGHEGGLRPGTENVPGIAGLGKAAEVARRDLEARVESAWRLRRLFLDGLAGRLPGLRLNGHPELTLPGTLNLLLPGTVSSDIVASLGEKVALSAGSACHEGVSAPSGVLKAMGLSDEDAVASLRVSLGKDNTEEEIRAAVEMLSETASRRARKP
ncbi:MAG: cysteine desulfurase family protein [Nitrospirota bacterium]|jgi:cysteine desulfurase